MSTIWTPSGERPVPREQEPQSQPPSGAQPPAGGFGPPRGVGDEDEPTEEEMRAEMAEVARQVVNTPASVVVANHCIGLFQLAALHLDQPQPRYDEAQVAIDALAAIVGELGPRLGPEEETLRDAVTQIRLAFVQRRSGGAPSEG